MGGRSKDRTVRPYCRSSSHLERANATEVSWFWIENTEPASAKHISFSEWWQVEDVASVVLCFCHVYNHKHSKLVARIRGTSNSKNRENRRQNFLKYVRTILMHTHTHISSHQRSMEPSVTIFEASGHFWTTCCQNSKSHWVSIFRTGKESWDGTLVFQIPCLVSRSLDFHTHPNKVFRASKTPPSQGMTGGFWKTRGMTFPNLKWESSKNHWVFVASPRCRGIFFSKKDDMFHRCSQRLLVLDPKNVKISSAKSNKRHLVESFWQKNLRVLSFFFSVWLYPKWSNS